MKSVAGVNGSSKAFRFTTKALIFVAVLAILTTLVATAQGAIAQNVTVTEPRTIAAARPECKVQAKDLTTVESMFDVEETVARLETEITGRGLGVFAVIDHAANAESVGLELRPTAVILFGSPTVGTLLMQSEQTIGIDLPLKYLVWEDECETVRIGYNSTKFLANRHKIKDRDQVFENISNALNAIAQAAAGS